MKTSTLILTLLCLATLTGCFTKKTSKRKTSTTNNTGTTNSNGNGTSFFNPNIPPTSPTATPTLDPSGEFGQNGSGTGFGDGNDSGVSDGGQTTEYFSLDNIIVHGTANPNRNRPPNDILWSSEVNIAPADQDIFRTDARFNVRIRAQRGPGQNTKDIRGVDCRFNNDYYQKLQVTTCLRKKNGSCIYTHTFSDIPVGQVSKVKEFSVPQNTSDPLVLEITDVQWDYSCVFYGIQGDSNQPGLCPWGPVWDTQCVKLDVQFSTDSTTDLPGARY